MTLLSDTKRIMFILLFVQCISAPKNEECLEIAFSKSLNKQMNLVRKGENGFKFPLIH